MTAEKIADPMDLSALRQAQELEALLAAHRARQPKPNTDQPDCRECGEAIAPQRMALGARLCIGCATAEETKARQRGGR